MDLSDRQRRLRIRALEWMTRQGQGHSGRVLSAIDLMEALYFGVEHERPIFNFDPKNPDWDGRDYFVLSKLEAAPGLMMVLKEAGYLIPDFTAEGLDRKTPGIEVNLTESAYGLSAAVGIAAALQAQRSPRRVYTLVADYELERGMAWEAILLAAELKLDKLCILLDENDPKDNPVQERFEAFGWKVLKLLKPHDHQEIVYAIERAKTSLRKPVCIWAPTIKSKGVPFAERKADYDDTIYSEAELAEARKILI